MTRFVNLRTSCLFAVAVFFLFTACEPGPSSLREPANVVSQGSSGATDGPRLAKLVELAPKSAAECTAERATELVAAARAVDESLNDFALQTPVESPQEALFRVRELLTAKNEVDALFNQTIALRGAFVDIPEEAGRRDAIRAFLKICWTWIDLSGRLRYLQRDAIDRTLDVVEGSPAQFDTLIDLFVKHHSSIGASRVEYLLDDPPADSDSPPTPLPLKREIVALFAAAGDTETLPVLARVALDPTSPPELVVDAALAIEAIGLPQDARPGQGKDVDLPEITAAQLHRRLGEIDATSLPGDLNAERTKLLAWLDNRAKHGVTEDTFRVGRFELREGDWLLMRNPSPYNAFTDLAPGLFTHVGVVTAENGSDGKRRFVIVDLPERGDAIPAINADAYVLRTLHYFFVRHPDPSVAKKMAEIARGIIGNETQFDLKFDTQRVYEMKGKPLDNAVIHTYCAGLLVLCAQETTAPLADFFPIWEHPAPGNTLENLGILGIWQSILIIGEA